MRRWRLTYWFSRSKYSNSLRRPRSYHHGGAEPDRADEGRRRAQSFLLLVCYFANLAVAEVAHQSTCTPSPSAALAWLHCTPPLFAEATTARATPRLYIASARRLRKVALESYRGGVLVSASPSKTDWRNGSASDSSPEGYVFESRIGHALPCRIRGRVGLRRWI